MSEENEQIHQRREKLGAIREKGNAFPNDFRRDHLAAELHDAYGGSLPDSAVAVKVAGRMMLQRVMGKASFVTIQDGSGRIQLYLRRDAMPEGVYDDLIKQLDIGDIVGAEGELFHTQKGELTVRVSAISLLTKSLRPLPE